MKNSNLRGAGTVFRYTVRQHYKNISVIIFLAFLFLAALAAFPFMKMQFGSKEAESTMIKMLYLNNQTPYPVSADDIRSNPVFAELKVKDSNADEKALSALLNKDSEAESAAAVITLDEEKLYFRIKTYYGENGTVVESDAGSLNSQLEKALHNAVMQALNVTEAQENLMHCYAVSKVAKAADYGSGEQESSTDTHVFANMIYSYMTMILCLLAMSYIFQLCMEEKMSKLVESLLVSVTPTALLIGKILAVTLFIFFGLGLVAAGLIISYHISGIGSDLNRILEAAGSLSGFDISTLHISAGTVCPFIICILLAYAIGACFSGIVGSCCSKTEDMQSASLATALFLMLGYLSGTFAPMFESDVANHILSLFPVTSIFTAFPNYICGKIGLPVFILALILQAALAAVLARIAGAVYKMMLLYRGNVPKPKQLIDMLRETYAANKTSAKQDQSGQEN